MIAAGRRPWCAIGLLAAVLACTSCSSGVVSPPAVVVGVQPGVIRELQMEATAGADHSSRRVWALNEADGARWSGLSLAPGSRRAAPVTTTHLYPEGGRWLLARQILSHDGDRQRDDLFVPPPDAVSLLDAGGLGIDLYTELARSPLSRDVSGAPAGCSDHAVPIATVAMSVLDPADVPAGTSVTVAAGTDPTATVRLCGPARELARVSAPPSTITTRDGPPLRAPAVESRFTPVSRRHATPALIRATFDLAQVYPQARVVHGSLAPQAGALDGPG